MIKVLLGVVVVSFVLLSIWERYHNENYLAATYYIASATFMLVAVLHVLSLSEKERR